MRYEPIFRVSIWGVHDGDPGGERGVIDYDQVVTLPIKPSHSRTQLLGPHNDSHRDSSGSERGWGNLNSDPGVWAGWQSVIIMATPPLARPSVTDFAFYVFAQLGFSQIIRDFLRLSSIIPSRHTCVCTFQFNFFKLHVLMCNFIDKLVSTLGTFITRSLVSQNVLEITNCTQ